MRQAQIEYDVARNWVDQTYYVYVKYTWPRVISATNFDSFSEAQSWIDSQ